MWNARGVGVIVVFCFLDNLCIALLCFENCHGCRITVFFLPLGLWTLEEVAAIHNRYSPLKSTKAPSVCYTFLHYQICMVLSSVKFKQPHRCKLLHSNSCLLRKDKYALL